jgi:hypothetical protein
MPAKTSARRTNSVNHGLAKVATLEIVEDAAGSEIKSIGKS